MLTKVFKSPVYVILSTGRSDFMAVGFDRDYLVFRFDLGSG